MRAADHRKNKNHDMTASAMQTPLARRLQQKVQPNARYRYTCCCPVDGRSMPPWKKRGNTAQRHNVRRVRGAANKPEGGKRKRSRRTQRHRDDAEGESISAPTRAAKVTGRGEHGCRCGARWVWQRARASTRVHYNVAEAGVVGAPLFVSSKAVGDATAGGAASVPPSPPDCTNP